jgi:hypothetical protein
VFVLAGGKIPEAAIDSVAEMPVMSPAIAIILVFCMASVYPAKRSGEFHEGVVHAQNNIPHIMQALSSENPSGFFRDFLPPPESPAVRVLYQSGRAIGGDVLVFAALQQLDNEVYPNNGRQSGAS